MKKALVLGSDGYLGKHLIKRLLKGKDVVVYSADKSDVDLRDFGQCIQFFYTDRDYQEIYQFAAISGNMKYLLSSGYSYGDSTLININIIKALNIIDYEGKILFPSSFYVHDTTNKYGIEKLYNEHIYTSSGLDVRIARLFSVYGPGERLNSSGEKVTTAFCRKFIESSGTITIKGSPTQVRYFLYITDVIEGLISQMKLDQPSTLEFAGDDEITFGEMVRVIERIDGRKHKLSYTMDNQDESVVVPATKSTKAILEWQPEVTFEEGMEKLYRWVDNELC